MELYPFQQEGITFLKNTQRAILGDEPGLGKTAQVLKTCEETNAKRVLIICPNTIKQVWVREIAKWVTGSVIVVEGTKKKRQELLLGNQVYTIINYESLIRHAKIKPKSAELEPELQQQWDTIIIDEAHIARSRKSQIAKVIKQIARNTKNLYELTGTPILNKVMDLWVLLNILQPKQFSSYWRFAQRYCEIYHNGYAYQIEDIINEQDPRVQRLRRDLAPFMLRRLKKEVFTQMPAKTVQQIWVKLQGGQAHIYCQMEKDMLSLFSTGELVRAPVVIAQITRLKQIALDPYLMTGANTSISGAKIDAVKDILNSCEGKKVVIFSQFVTALNRLQPVLESIGITNYAMLTGEITGKDRQDQIDKFQNDPTCPVLLCSTKAGGVGLTLTAASIAIFLDKLWTPAMNEQAQSRLHRIGQTEPVTIYEILAQDTIEEDIEALLAFKQNITDSAIELLGRVKVRH